MRVAVIGSGVSGIGAAKVLKQCGYDVTVYERSEWIGGVWCVGYPDLHLQVPLLFSLLSLPLT
jgi:cation diffusion facilitator CzcD-associated flavoprotein CzcO